MAEAAAIRVLHVIPSLGPLRGGPSEALRTLARGLAAAGLDVHVAATDDNGPERLQVPHGAPVSDAGATCWYFPRQTRLYSFSRPLSRWLRQQASSYDIVHVHSVFNYPALTAARCAKSSGIPYIIRPLGTLNRWGMENRRPWLKRLSLRLIESRLLAGAAAIHFTSEQERLEALELGVRGRSAIIPNPVDPPLVAPGRFPRPAGSAVILFLGRLDPKKGLDLLLPAFARVRAEYSSAKLVIAGSGDPAYTARLQDLAKQLGIASDTIWTGFLDNAGKWVALAAADVFVLPSYSENFGIAALEAMACGRPVIVSDQTGIHREIAEARAGLVTSCQIDPLAQAILCLLQNTGLRSAMGQNGKHLAQTRFSLDAVVSALMRLYGELLHRVAEPAVEAVV